MEAPASGEYEASGGWGPETCISSSGGGIATVRDAAEVKLTGSLGVVLRVEVRLDHRFFLAGRVVITHTGAVATGSPCSVVSVRTAAVV
jgi:hypothetical protein